MDCTQFTDRLAALLDGALPEAARARAAAHAAGCPDCRLLQAAVQGALEPPAAEAPDGLTGAILARTSGRPCGRAQALLGDLVDGVLSGADRDVIDAHLRHCPDCAVLTAALARLAEDLPAFAALRPDSGLVVDVLARTPARRRSGLLDGILETGRRLLARPRIAWEAGCVAALVVWLISGASGSPLQTTAVEVQAFVQRGAAGAQAAGARSAEALDRTVAALRRETVRVAVDGAGEVAGWISRLSSWPRRAAGAAPELGRHWRQFTRALQDRDVFGGVDALRSLSRDAGAMLAELLFSPFSATTPMETTPTPTRRNEP